AVILSESKLLDENDFTFRKSSSLSTFNTLDLEDNEVRIIQAALKKHNNNYTEAANELGITRRTLYNKIKKYGF
ncbi:MAG: helix-turn-helix domain-containing protein, partial [Bacteroidales bacterium]|nr:helix-turn-helix domain-containing protein [Bacteroidales bacterium]